MSIFSRVMLFLTCERQTFLPAHNRLGTFRFISSAAISEEKRLLSAGYVISHDPAWKIRGKKIPKI